MVNAPTSRPQPLKRWLANHIKEEVRSGARQVGEPLESERDLCTKYSVSRITVRAALEILEDENLIRRHPGRGAVLAPLVSMSTTDLVKVSAGRASNLGRCAYIRWSNNPLESNLVAGFERYCSENKLSSVLLDARASHESFLRYLENPPEGAEGIALIPYDTPEYIRALATAARHGIEVVLLDRKVDGHDLSSVTVDNFGGAYQATNHLFQQVNRPVFYIGYRTSPSSSRERLEGWRSAMEEHGVRDWESHLIEITRSEIESAIRPSDSWRDGYEAANRLFDGNSRGVGYSLFVLNDYCAQGVYRSAAERNLQVGRDILLVGFDDLPLARHQTPPLSSVYQPRESMGYLGAKMLHQRMIERSQRPIHQVLPIKLVVRASSTPTGAAVKVG